MKQSQWMRGLLWAEDYVGNDSDKVRYLAHKLLYWEEYLYLSSELRNIEFRSGAINYIKHYEERLK